MAGFGRKALAAFGIVALGGLSTAGPASAAEGRQSVRFLTSSGESVTCEFEYWTIQFPGPEDLIALTQTTDREDERCDATVRVTVRYEDIYGIRREVRAEAEFEIEVMLDDVGRDITSTHFVRFSDCMGPRGACEASEELRTK
jgi:hypothetical protein